VECAIAYREVSLYLSSQYPTSNETGNSFRLSTVLQILLYLPLTLATLSTPAFLLLSLLLSAHSLIHGTLILLWGSRALSVMQVPMHPFLLLVTFNAFSQSVHPMLATAASWWGKILTFSGPTYVAMEGLSSLLFAQKVGQVGKELADEAESYQFAILIASAVAYVVAAWWIVVVGNLYRVLCTRPDYYPTGIPSCSRVTSFVDITGCGIDRFLIPDGYWIPPSTYKHRRILHALPIPRLQHLALWF
jgi:hypothetical protein